MAGSYIDNTKDRWGDGSFGKKALYHGVNAQIIGTDLWPSGVETNHTLFGIDLSKHVKHIVKEVMVQVKHSLPERNSRVEMMSLS